MPNDNIFYFHETKWLKLHKKYPPQSTVHSKSLIFAIPSPQVISFRKSDLAFSSTINKIVIHKCPGSSPIPKRKHTHTVCKYPKLNIPHSIWNIFQFTSIHFPLGMGLSPNWATQNACFSISFKSKEQNVGTPTDHGIRTWLRPLGWEMYSDRY